jgi:hypothetical protein
VEHDEREALWKNVRAASADLNAATAKLLSSPGDISNELRTYLSDQEFDGTALEVLRSSTLSTIAERLDGIVRIY